MRYTEPRFIVVRQAMPPLTANFAPPPAELSRNRPLGGAGTARKTADIEQTSNAIKGHTHGNQ
jgi:hypothetical protein